MQVVEDHQPWQTDVEPHGDPILRPNITSCSCNEVASAFGIGWLWNASSRLSCTDVLTWPLPWLHSLLYMHAAFRYPCDMLPSFYPCSARDFCLVPFGVSLCNGSPILAMPNGDNHETAMTGQYHFVNSLSQRELSSPAPVSRRAMLPIHSNNDIYKQSLNNHSRSNTKVSAQ